MVRSGLVEAQNPILMEVQILDLRLKTNLTLEGLFSDT